MGRIKVNLTLDAEVAETARALGLNMSRLAEQAIAEAAKAERNRLWNLTNLLVAVVGYDSTIREVNPAWPALLGWSQAEMVGRSYTQFVHPDDIEGLEETLEIMSDPQLMAEIREGEEAFEKGDFVSAVPHTTLNNEFGDIARAIGMMVCERAPRDDAPNTIDSMRADGVSEIEGCSAMVSLISPLRIRLMRSASRTSPSLIAV